jgi:Predicted permeases
MTTIILAILAGLATGVLSGLVGIGGGIVLVPMLLYLFRTDMHVAAGTSLAVIVPTAIAGVVTHFTAGNVSLKLGLALAPGAIVGAMLGAYLASILPADTLKRVFAVILLVISIRIFLDSFELLGSKKTATAKPAVETTVTTEEGNESR